MTIGELTNIAISGIACYFLLSLVIVWMVRDSLNLWRRFGSSLPSRATKPFEETDFGAGLAYIGATKFRFITAAANSEGIFVRKKIFPFSAIFPAFFIPWELVASIELIPNTLTVDGKGEVDAVLWLQNRAQSICLPWKTELSRFVPSDVGIEDTVCA